MSTPTKRLNLETETISELTEEQLSNIAGGAMASTGSRSILSAVSATKTGTETSDISTTSVVSRETTSIETGDLT